eukprot:TRINITY_DN1167_c0_g1_i3.p1 TRINITY_DN1167_c0_g1~~TRINITY_DN1167_c0_g1_i3.p1  ORF type:complete len:411 (-),score=24.57 TRINITY_DN1167_c0_g1_i3:105-1337(-)
MELIMESVLCLGAGYVIWANTKLKREKFAQWSELPDDVLCFILRKLNLADYVRCSAVCVSWRRLVAQKPYPPTNELPWLMLPEFKYGEIRNFFNLSKGRVCRIKLPKFYGSRCCGSSEGWLVMASEIVDGSPKNFLLNPISGAQIQLPSQITIPIPLAWNLFFIIKAVLSSAPTSDNISAGNCIVVGIVTSLYNNLVFCRPGDEKWSMFEATGARCHLIYTEDKERHCLTYRDILYCNRQFYALAHSGELTICEFAPHPKTITVDIPPAIQNDRNTIHYLAEFSGELLLIVRICPYHFRLDEVAVNGFQNFKFDASVTRWVEVGRLDDCALFLGKNNFISLAASQYQGLIRGNCIYLTGCNNEFGHYECKHWYRDSAIFCLDDGSVKPYFSSHWDSYCKSPPIWITPNPW